MSLYRDGFQTFVNTYMPPGVVGAFASMNPRATVLAGQGALKSAAGADAPFVGFFARALNGLATKVVSPGDGILGFVANELQAVITEFLGQSKLQTQPGFPITLYSHGDFWTTVIGATPASVGLPVYALAGTGAPTLDDDSGSNPETGFIVASAPGVSGSSNGSCSIAANTGVLTVAATVTGTFEAGQNISGTGSIAVPNNLFILNQISGTPGGAGTYQLNYQGAAITAITNLSATSGQLVKISRTY